MPRCDATKPTPRSRSRSTSKTPGARAAPAPRPKSASAERSKPCSESTASASPGTGTPPVRLEWVDPATLDAHRDNWRTHPPGQVAALDAVLSDPDIGWAGVLLYNEHPDCRRLVD